jgi:8-oxo-dGTP pyrophosphatase MutT (NUDIX family)
MAHTHDTLCLTVVIFLTHQNKVLLAHHPVYDAWLPIGGHIDPGEDPDETLYREVKEETSLDPEDIRIFGNKADIPTDDNRTVLYTPAFVDRHNVGDRNHVAFVYFGEMTDGREVLKSEEHKELRWFTADELKNGVESFKPDIVWYALHALKMATQK